MKNKNNNTLIITGAGLIVLGIIFISATMNKRLSYSFIVAGLILEIIIL